MTKNISCPFVYANGKHCSGHIRQVRAYGRTEPGEYGPERHEVRKYRLWCSEGDDHCGAISGLVAKERMEFYPDELPEGVIDALWEADSLWG